MNQQKLQKIYPTSSVHAFPADRAEYLSLAMTHGFLWIPQKGLSKTEKELLQTLNVSNIPPFSVREKEHPWYAALFSKASIPANKGAFRLIQVECQGLSANDLTALQEEVSVIFPHAVDLFFLSKNYCLIIESFSEGALTTEELAGLFLALDSDFNSYTRVFNGAFHSFTADFPQLLHEEEQLFLHLLERDTQAKVFDTGAAAISFFIFQDVTKSYLLQTLFTEWFNKELVQIITTLWQNQGNISSAAKELFMHRNTLQYKVDKFQQQSNTNLKKMNDLFLCYLLVLSFKNSN